MASEEGHLLALRPWRPSLGTVYPPQAGKLSPFCARTCYRL